MKNYTDFLNEVSKEMGYPEYRHMWVDAITIHEKAAARFGAYCFEEGCKAQRAICYDNA